MLIHICFSACWLLILIWYRAGVSWTFIVLTKFIETGETAFNWKVKSSMSNRSPTKKNKRGEGPGNKYKLRLCPKSHWSAVLLLKNMSSEHDRTLLNTPHNSQQEQSIVSVKGVAFFLPSGLQALVCGKKAKQHKHKPTKGMRIQLSSDTRICSCCCWCTSVCVCVCLSVRAKTATSITSSELTCFTDLLSLTWIANYTFGLKQ